MRIRCSEAEGPLFPSGIRILSASPDPAEAAENGLRHQVACLYHCNRQVSPGELVSAALMPLACARLPLDEQSDHLFSGPSAAIARVLCPLLCADSSCAAN